MLSLRSKSFLKDETKLEIITLEILQDLVSYQEQGKKFTEVYGDDIDKFANSIFENLPNENKKQMLSLLLVSILMFITSSTFFYVFNSNIEPYIILLNVITSGIFGMILLYILVYRKTKQNKIFIYTLAFISYNLSIFLIPILKTFDVFKSPLILSVENSIYIKLAYLCFALFSIIYTVNFFKKN
ncbi:hypothetical protein [Gemella cuniculi]|uniref:hypothetical protein n=1 Tax=Gemella cuniculi TaxID=150240 RepID=UPI000417E8F7|nr:hypothetical protein [Gemella cuniculi]